MLMQNFGVTNKEHYGMLWYFLEWSIPLWSVYACILTELWLMSHAGEGTVFPRIIAVPRLITSLE